MTKRITHYTVAIVLVLGVLGIGIAAYRQQALADTVVAGFSTAHLHFNVTVPVPQTITIKATFTPPTGKTFYFKERNFEITSGGLNTVEWYIRKIPGQNYNLTLTSPQGALQGTAQTVTLQNDSVVEVGSFDLNLGSPSQTKTPVPTPTATKSVKSSNSATVTVSPEASSTSDEIPFPPIPTL